MGSSQDKKQGWLRSRAGRAPRTRSVLAATAVLVIGISSFAVARTGDVLRQGIRNSTASRETQIVSRIAGTDNNTGGYTTRQSNLSSSGGGAFYGCRSGAPNSSGQAMEPCLRANNLSTGLAFEFNTTHGVSAGSITVAGGGDTTKPFSTNATGVATGLNADRVDSKSADEIVSDAVAAASRFADVAADGKLNGGRGAASVTVQGPVTDGTYRVVFTDDISKCALTATEQTITDAGAVAVQRVDAKTVDVRTRKGGGADGTGPSDPAQRPFHLVATC
jgi:hypothetical protein